MQVTVRQATEADLLGILDIANDAILNSTAIWSHYALSLDNRRAWLAERHAKNYPVLVAIIGSEVAGFSSFGDFRPHDGYLHSVEHSVYVHRHHHGKGIGKQLMLPLFDAAKALGKHVMIGGVDAGNEGSLKFHRDLGFTEAGRLKEVGFKFDRWLDLIFVQKILAPLASPPL